MEKTEKYTMLIADDDEITRESIRRFLLKSFPDRLQSIWTAKDGQEAFELFEEHHTDLVLTDIAMPRCDGLELVEHLHQSGYNPKVVIISAHENFSYAQNAVRLGVGEYLLKPILPAKIREITGNLLDDLDQHGMFLNNITKMMNMYQENLPVLRERFFNTIIQEDLDERRILEKAKLVDIDLRGLSYTVAALKVESPGAAPEQALAAEKFANFLATVIEALFPPDIHVYYIMVTSVSAALIIISDKEDSPALFRTVNTCLNRLLKSAMKYTDLLVTGAVGRQYTNVLGIRISYREALNALISVNSRESGIIRNYEDIAPGRVSALRMDGDLENHLLQGVKYQPYSQCVEYIDQMVQNVAEYQYQYFYNIQTYFLKLTVLLWRELQNSGGQDEFRINFSELLGTADLESCITWFKRFTRDIVDSYQRLNAEKGNSLINRAKHIINDNIGNSDFSIDEVAAALYISSNYLRQIFREQSEESFVEYLTRIRMEKAMELLKNPGIKIQDIAETTGFSNQRYFAVCFKKHFGRTPTECRGTE